MTLYKVYKYYNDRHDHPYYDVMPCNFKGHLKCCLKWYGLKGLKWCYLFEKRAECKAMKLNERMVSK